MEVGEEEEEEATISTARGAKSPAPFLSKTYELLEEEGGRGEGRIVSWNGEGNGFVVWSRDEFSQQVLPRYFKHCNFSSFIRQLNTYGFKKTASDRWEFQHPKFKRGGKELLVGISRRKCAPSIFPSFLQASCKQHGSSSSSSSSTLTRAAAVDDQEAGQLLEENQQLQRQNCELLSQIAHFKAMQVHLLGRLSHFIGCSTANSSGNGSGDDQARKS